jgi:O-antigen ligase
MKGDKKIFVAYLVVLFLLPLPLGSNREWAWLAASAVVFLLAALLLWQLSERRIDWSPVWASPRLALVCLLAWLSFGLIQVLPLPPSLVGFLSPERLSWPLPWQAESGWVSISVAPDLGFLAWLQSLFLVVFFCLTLQLANSRRRVERILLVFVLAGVMQALYGSFMTMSGLEWGFLQEKEHGRGVATGTYVNRNHLAGLLVICLSAGIGLLMSHMRPVSRNRGVRQRLRGWVRVLLGPKTRLRLYLGIMVVGLVLSHSRMGNASFFVSLLITGLAGLWLMRRAPRPVIVLIASLLVVDILIIGTWFGVEQVVERIQQTGSYQETTGRYQDQERLDVDTETLGAWKDYAWVGSGGGSFAIVFSRYRQPDLGTFFDHGHNDFLEFLLEYGVVGCMPLGVFFLASLATAINAQRRRRDSLMRATGFAVTMVAVASAIHASVDFNLHIPANAAYLTVLLALAWVAAELPSKRIKAIKNHR